MKEAIKFIDAMWKPTVRELLDCERYYSPKRVCYAVVVKKMASYRTRTYESVKATFTSPKERHISSTSKS